MEVGKNTGQTPKPLVLGNHPYHWDRRSYGRNLSTTIGEVNEQVMVGKMRIDVIDGRGEAGPATANKVVLNEFLDGFHRLDFCIRQNYAEGKTEG